MKIAIVGAGSVGTAIAYASAIKGLADEITLYDLNGAKATAEILDLRHGLQFVPPVDIGGGDDLDACRNADVVVITAGAKQQPGQSRMELAGVNAGITRDLVPKLFERAADAVLLFVTNPVDVVTFVGQEVAAGLGVPVGRVIGSGTVLDTSRLRHELATRLSISESSVHATIAGEHGDSEIALWSTANVGGAPLPLDQQELDELLHETRNAAYRIIEGKGATNLAIGLSTARILAAIGSDERAVLPICSRHEFDGVGEVCLSLPTVVGAGGAIEAVDVPLSDDERSGLLASARAVRAAIDAV
ncbi:MAG: NAD(P)-binding domain-containing protein [Ilumatobacter sp.]|nr:NAD(P)-binding domain-containing protein [Ilumatobacter sp.]